MTVVVGTSGWQYDDWKNVLYEGVPRARWLEHYASVFPAVEVNNTFYNLPKEKTFSDWGARTRDGFTFVCKASRFITHIRRLEDVAEPITRFVERASLLGEKLGPMLYQLPPSMKRNDEVMKSFLDLLPAHPPASIEFRHDSWYDPALYQALRDHDVALVVADSPKHRTPLETTASWAYLRLHGGEDEASYGGEALEEWAGRIADLARGADPIYVFFARICHQDPQRSWAIAGQQLPVCIRCASIYFGFFVASIFTTLPNYKTLQIAVLATLIEVLIEYTGILGIFSPWLRSGTGLVLGASVAPFVITGFDQMLRKYGALRGAV